MTRPHFLGTDASPSPLVPDLLVATKALSDAGVKEGAVSARYGPRFVVNAAGVPLGMLADAHFVEVADYDPHTDQTLCLGAHAPHALAPLSALVYRAKKEVNALAHVELADDVASALPEDVPRVERARTPLDTAMRVLEALRASDAVVLGERELIVTADSPPKVADRVRALTGAT